jgi:sulfate transport system substrate-binding protein
MISFRRSLSALLLSLLAGSALADATLLNASYDVARDVYKDYNPLFQKYWKAKTGESLELKQSHGGSSKQVRAVADGLEADVVTLNQANDVEFWPRGAGRQGLDEEVSRTMRRLTPRRWFSSSARGTRRAEDWGDLAAPGVRLSCRTRRTPATGAIPTCRPGPGR